MADGDRITLVIEGLPEDEGRVRFSAFVAELQHLAATINRLDREAYDGKASSYFRIAELSYSSPARVVIEPSALPGRPPIGHIVIQNLARIANVIDGGGDLHDFDVDLLDDIRSLARPVGVQVRSAALVFNDHRIELTQQLSRRVEAALAVDDECEGTIEGMLEQINVHLGANTFHIYPDVGPKKVACRFSGKLYDDALAAVGKRVGVSGVMRFRAKADYPHQMLVSDIEIFPPEHDLPNWDDLRGRAPDATGDVSSEAYVRELRNAWG